MFTRERERYSSLKQNMPDCSVWGCKNLRWNWRNYFSSSEQKTLLWAWLSSAALINFKLSYDMKKVFATHRNVILWLFLCNAIILFSLSFLPMLSHLVFFWSSPAIDTHTSVPVQPSDTIPLIFPESPHTSLLPTLHCVPPFCSWMPYFLGKFCH